MNTYWLDRIINLEKIDKDYNININEVISNVEDAKIKLVSLFTLEMKRYGFIYNHNDKFNENEVTFKYSSEELSNKVFTFDIEKYNESNCYKILDDFYDRLYIFRKLILIKNKCYFSSYIYNLTNKYLVNHDFNSDLFDNNKVNSIIRNNINNIIDYPIYSLVYDIDHGERKQINILYADYLFNKEKYNNYENKDYVTETLKKLYFELFNNALIFSNLEDINNLILEFDGVKVIDFINDLKEYNSSKNINNTNVNKLLKRLNDNIDYNGSDIYKVLYSSRKDEKNNERFSSSNK